MLKNAKKEWFSNIKKDLLAGIVVCMALIPEAIGFSIVAGVDPMVGVYASFVISVITAIFGGRTGLISAAAGATALVLASLVKDYGVQYLFAATILAGLIQAVLGYFKIGNLMKFIPKPVMIGFVNALGILMFQSQIGHFKGSYILIVLGILGIGIIYLFPKITKSIPSPIVAIFTITLIVNIFKIDITMLGDMGNITKDLPKFMIPNIPFNLETLNIILPYSISVALVGIVESLLTAQLIDDLTDTPSDKNRECIGQGLANIGAGFFGGIAGCGMIGQTIINNNYGGRGRLSTLTAGTAMLFSIILLNEFVVNIPVVALASVMIVVSITTFDFESIKRIKFVPKSDTLIMMSTVFVVLLTHNLAYGVVVGIIISALVFASKTSEIEINKNVINSFVKFDIKGPLFFASTTKFIDAFDYSKDITNVEIDFTHAKICDESAVSAIDKVILKYKSQDVDVKLIGFSIACSHLFDKVSVHDKETSVSSH